MAKKATSAPAGSAKKRVTNAHTRTRRDHSQETAEDYVEAIAEILRQQEACRISDLARHFAVSHVTVHRIITRLQSEGLVSTEPYRPVVLTEQGAEIAARSRQRHEVVFNFLLTIGVPPEMAAIDAEGIEHHVSPQTLQCMERWIAQASQNP